MATKFGWVNGQPGMSAAEQVSEGLANLSRSLHDTRGVTDHGTAELGISWQGPAADAAQKSLTTTAEGVADSGTIAQNGADRMLDHGRSFEAMRRQIVYVNPDDFSWIQRFGDHAGEVWHTAWGNGTDHVTIAEHNQANDEVANRALQQYATETAATDDRFTTGTAPPPGPSAGGPAGPQPGTPGQVPDTAGHRMGGPGDPVPGGSGPGSSGPGGGSGPGGPGSGGSGAGATAPVTPGGPGTPPQNDRAGDRLGPQPGISPGDERGAGSSAGPGGGSNWDRDRPADHGAPRPLATAPQESGPTGMGPDRTSGPVIPAPDRPAYPERPGHPAVPFGPVPGPGALRARDELARTFADQARQQQMLRPPASFPGGRGGPGDADGPRSPGGPGSPGGWGGRGTGAGAGAGAGTGAWSTEPRVPGSRGGPADPVHAGRPPDAARGSGVPGGYGPMMGGGAPGETQEHRNRYVVPSAEVFAIEITATDAVLGPEQDHR
ncbi:hypothetical protein [Pseudonocardia parietis]|uniref:PPE family protein n=1 Tax=Pseudonocardia parietis TaxID=570936 RepID=A0ABS4VM31_9PSEU|nr:hypothetical protein [Pseudonocardia parietis]MBP2364979.1 hypothetical protein [Pseudonocardia parietis]